MMKFKLDWRMPAIASGIGSLIVLLCCMEIADVKPVLAQHPIPSQSPREVEKQEASRFEEDGKKLYLKGHFFEAKQAYQQSLKRWKTVGDKSKIAHLLVDLAEIEVSLGHHTKALSLLQESHTLAQEIGNLTVETEALVALSLVYQKLDNPHLALSTVQNALEFSRVLDSPVQQSHLYNQIASIYTTLKRYPQALDTYHTALSIFQRLGDRPGEANTLNGIALVYTKQEEFEAALAHFYQALLILKTSEETGNYATTLHNIGHLFESKKQEELAILFYKESINHTHLFPKRFSEFSITQPQATIARISHRYRHLADLLLQHHRSIEAHQVLDLLKLQELDEYLNTTNNHQQTPPLMLHPVEQEILTQFLDLQAQGVQWIDELDRLLSIPEQSRTIEQNNRLSHLQSLYHSLQDDFDRLIQQLDLAHIRDNLAQENTENTVINSYSQSLKDVLKPFDRTTALLYPFILEDRLEIMVIFADRPPIRRTISVTQSEFESKIAELRTVVTRQYPLPRVQSVGNQLYQWLIEPIKMDLEQAGIQSLVYAPDGQLRYLPLTALYDGNRWLVEQFRVTHITATSLRNFVPQSHRKRRILAGAFTEGDYQVEVGDRQFAFSGLPFAQQEVENLVESFPDHTALWNQNFSRDSTLPQLKEHQIIHLATHAAFVQGEPEESFILLGNGDRITLRDIEQWNLSDVDLVVLSACQTALGEILGTGEEILGLGYQVQKAGAKAAIATLWKVDDRGTQLLMDEFYQVLDRESNIQLAEAIRQAQLHLIKGNISPATDADINKFKHPYYWAPFIIIGNGL